MKENHIKACLDVLVFLVTFIPLVLLRAFFLMKTWLWFVVPPFHLSPLTLPQTVGLVIFLVVVSYRQKHGTDTTKTDWSKDYEFPFVKFAIGSVMTSLTFFGVSYLWHVFYVH